MKLLQQTHDAVESIDCFSSIGLQYQSMFPVKVKTKSCIDIFKRNKLASDKLINMREKLVQKLEDITKVAVEKAHETPIDMIDNTPIEIIDPVIELNPLEPYIEIEDDIDIIKEITEVTKPLLDVTNEELNSNVFAEESTEQKMEKNIGSEDIIKEDEIIQKKDNEPKMKHSSIRKPNKMRSKLKDLIESHYRSKGSIIETDHKEDFVPQSMPIQQSAQFKSAKTNIKRIIKAEKIKDLVDRISKLDLTKHCDLEALSTKDCLKKIIDEYDIEPDRL